MHKEFGGRAEGSEVDLAAPTGLHAILVEEAEPNSNHKSLPPRNHSGGLSKNVRECFGRGPRHRGRPKGVASMAIPMRVAVFTINHSGSLKPAQALGFGMPPQNSRGSLPGFEKLLSEYHEHWLKLPRKFGSQPTVLRS
eukprot:scaffold298765_cov19-Tisochrysis_lutea.AAC.1